MTSKTEKALEYLAKHPKATVYEAAKEIGVCASVVYRAVAKQNRPRCPSCGHLINK